jgi:hypothetical protein
MFEDKLVMLNYSSWLFISRTLFVIGDDTVLAAARSSHSYHFVSDLCCKKTSTCKCKNSGQIWMSVVSEASEADTDKPVT